MAHQELKSFLQVNTQARHWLLTIFDKNEQQAFIDKKRDYKFFSYQDEKCPDTGKEHLQAYCGFEKPIRFNQLKKWWPTAHIEMARNFKHAFEYCLKEETRLPGGRHECSSLPSAGGGSEWACAVDYIKSGKSWYDLIDEFPGLYATKEAGLRKLFERHHKFDVNPIERCVIIFGPPGTGKTHTVKSSVGDRPYFRIWNGKWFDGYEYESIIWIDDFQPNAINRAGLLQLMETGDFRMEVKGGSTRVNVKEIYITSNWHPEDWFPEKEELLMKERAQAVIRRATTIHCPRDEEPVTVTAALGNTSLELLEGRKDKITSFFTKDRQRDRD